MDGPFVFVLIALFNRLSFHGLGYGGGGGGGNVTRFNWFNWFNWFSALGHHRKVVEHRILAGRIVKVCLGPIAFNEMRRRGGRLATPRRGHFGVLVFVVRVARRAPCLFDGVFDHRYHRMIGNTALTRTVVIDNVTEPRPALLHENPPEPIPSGGS
jgi:hypothetical protein